MKPISRRSVIASLAALAVTFGLLLPHSRIGAVGPIALMEFGKTLHYYDV